MDVSTDTVKTLLAALLSIWEAIQGLVQLLQMLSAGARG